MRLSLDKIKKEKPSKKRKHISVQDRSGLFFVVERENKGGNCKRFEGITNYPKGRGGKTVHVPMGVWGKDIKGVKDLNKTLRTWEDLKIWSKETGKHPKEYFHKDKKKKSSETLKEVFDEYLVIYKQQVKEKVFLDRQNKLNQMLRFFGEDTLISEMEWDNGGRRRIQELVKSMIARGVVYHSMRCCSVLKQCFDYAIREQLMRRDQNPASVPFDMQKVAYKPQNNPAISWKEVPDLMKRIEESNSSLLMKCAVKFYLMSCIRVGALVRFEWDWFDEENDMWVIPSDTPGLKRTMTQTGEKYDHLIPATPEMHKLMDLLRKMNGYQKYVFLSPDKGQFPHINPESINRFLGRLGYKNKLTAHGWRSVVVTAGQEDLEVDREVLRRQIGHTDHKSGAIGVYDRTNFIERRRDFMKTWTKELIKQGMKLS